MLEIVKLKVKGYEGRCQRRTSGIAMFAAIFVMLVIGILAMQFHFMTRQAQSTAFRFQASEIARQLAESAIDEAFLYVYNDSEKSDQDFFKKLVERTGSINCINTPIDSLAGKGVEVKIDMTRAEAAAMLNGDKFNLEAKARIIDFKDKDSKDGQYYGQEGVGTIEFKVAVTPKDEFKHQIKSACHITRHHDFKVVSIVSTRANDSLRTEYVQNYALDYALFLRYGQDEFDSTYGLSLNPEKQKFVIDQSDPAIDEKTCGKIFLGSRSGKYVYLNLDPARTDFIPDPVEKKKIAQADSAQVFKLLPTLHDSVKAEVNKEVKKQGARLESFAMKDHRAFFEYSRYPITNDALSSMKNLEEYRDVTLAGKAKFDNKKALVDYPPGFYIKPDDKLEKYLEGDIRQRFFHFGYFIVDLSDSYLRVKASKKKHGIRKSKTFTIPFPQKTVDEMLGERYPCFDADHLEGLPNANATLNLRYLKDTFGIPNPGIICKIHEENRYRKGSNDSFPKPEFFNYRTAEATTDPTRATVPYAHVNLWFRRTLSIDQAKELGIIQDNGNKLKLRGIVQISEPLELGNPGKNIEVEGQGVIVAPGFTIKSGIEKAEDDAICVLLSRGYPIKVNTDQPIEASLISMGRSGIKSGHIEANEKLDLRGALAVDVLRLDKWKEGVEHTIKYDPALKPDEDQYQVNISRWISFHRMVEHDDE
jgi:predicted nucleic acid binding AN1-type Zn finger protein